MKKHSYIKLYQRNDYGYGAEHHEIKATTIDYYEDPNINLVDSNIRKVGDGNEYCRKYII
jgi:hypothetical protein